MAFLRAAICGALFAFSLSAAAPEYGYRIVKVYPHDRRAFTQGLEFRDGVLYESTGQVGSSFLRKVKLETGEVLLEVKAPGTVFGEGITLLNHQIIHLTWQHQIGYVYDQSDFARRRSFSYPGEGWGLTNDGKVIYMSDGSSRLRVWDPATLKEERRINVRDGADDVRNLNELEFVRGEIYANVWMTEKIVRVSPADGHVLGWVDLSGLLTAADRTEQVDVLNGIAYDAARDRLFVTGKWWPKLFEIKLVPKSATGKK